MNNPFKSLGRPSIRKLQEQELYQTQREILGLEEHVYRYSVAERKASAALLCAQVRVAQLKEQLECKS